MERIRNGLFAVLQYVSMGFIGNPSSSNSESSIDDPRLPQDLINEILLRLPVKSLVKFKCVSRQWFSLISSPHFIKSHLSTSSKEGQYFTNQLLFTAPNYGMKHCSLYSALHDHFTDASDIEYPSKKHLQDVYPQDVSLEDASLEDVYLQHVNLRIVGIVNGLVCLAIEVNDLYLWNPVLRKSKHLPSSKFNLKDCTFVAYGFGYDELNDDYKVVIAPSIYEIGTEIEFNSEVKVYSLRADSWRRIEHINGGIHFDSAGKYANGKIFWADPSSMVIASLDMVSEEYEVVQGPDYEAGVDKMRIGVLGGRLYVLCDYKTKKADLWLMDKDGGVEDSWCRVISIPYDDVHRRWSIQRVLCISGNGDILLEDESGVIVYNSKSTHFRYYMYCCSYCQVFVYVESLVSPTT